MNITNTYVPVITTVKNDTTQHKLSKILTGDNTNIGLYLGICVLAIIGLYLLKKQRHSLKVRIKTSLFFLLGIM